MTMKSNTCQDGAHPRACGENICHLFASLFNVGSSPRMRGKPVQRLSRRSGPGLIPAHAGKTTRKPLHSASHRAHPRACGENRGPDLLHQVEDGSSPRMRGKPLPTSANFEATGLIPAHAGKTLCLTICYLTRQAHPRACGENVFTKSHAEDQRGSSPRMRGKRSPPRPGWRHRGLIPAHAGKTSTATA